MKYCSDALAAHLTQGQTTLAYLWKVKRTDGVILGFTTHDADIVYDAAGDLDGDTDGAIRYLARTGWANSAVQSKADLSVDNMEVTGFLDSEAIDEEDLRAGRYDESEISVRIVNWNDLTMGGLLIRSGTLGIGKMVSGIFHVEIRGLAYKLSTQLGSTYGPVCRATFGSGLNGIDMNSHWLCKVDVAPLRQTGIITAVPDGRTITPGGIAGGAAGFFDDGIVTFNSGALKGYSLEIKTWDGTSLELYLPMPFAPTPGDEITVEPGCDKTLQKCQFYNNVTNRRAEDFIPGMDQILATPDAG
jgi:uncharacterized phage protein (TIGR02218 family)